MFAAAFFAGLQAGTAAGAGPATADDTVIYASICANESYFFNSEDLYTEGTYSATFTAYDGSDSTVYLVLAVLPLTSGSKNVSICQGNSYVFNGTPLTQSGVYTAVLTGANGCDSTATLYLTVLPQKTVQKQRDICSGSFYVFYGDTLYDPGTYSTTFTAANGCDSTIVLQLDTVSYFEKAAQAFICPGEFYVLGNDTLSAEGVYVDTLTAGGGCDSIVTLTLGFLPLAVSVQNAVICSGEAFIFNGQILTSQGAYEFIFTGANGCDSSAILNLTVYPPEISVQSVSLCPGEVFDFNGHILSAEGVYTYHIPSSYNCDSTVIIVINHNEPVSVSVSDFLCAGSTYDFNGAMLGAPGVYTAVFTGPNGCDSTVTLTLTLQQVFASNVQATICEGSFYDFNGEMLSAAGVHTRTMVAANGCDSIVTLLLSVLSAISSALDVSICQGETYVVGGISLASSGNYQLGFQGSNGCDSTVNLHLEVLPVAHSAISASICQGSAYPVGGYLLTNAGNYTFTLNAANGCDSIVTLDLQVLPKSASGFSAVRCQGSVYQFYGQTLTSSGVYTKTLQSSNGCDSTLTLQLTFVPFYTTNQEAGICFGETYDFHGQNLTQPGDFTAVLTSTGGCDSIIYLHLSIMPASGSVTEASICPGQSYVFNGVSYNATGAYLALFTGYNGCDSTALLSLTVHPLVSTDFYETICAGESYAFAGVDLTASGAYYTILSDVNGCDSSLTLNLTVLPAGVSAFDAVICSGEAFAYNGGFLAQAGDYTFTLTDQNGCDSVVNIHLTEIPAAHQESAYTVCPGNTVEYNGEIYGVSGVYDFLFPNGAANGCDSVFTLNLQVLPQLPVAVQTASICKGESYDFAGMHLTGSGTYPVYLTSFNGCDSIVALVLKVAETSTQNIFAQICTGDSYPFDGALLTSPGVYTSTLTGQNGCDSTLILYLTVVSADTSVSEESGTLKAFAVNAQFQWLDFIAEMPVPGATSNTFTPGQTGVYAVIVTQNSCTIVSGNHYVEVVSTADPVKSSAWSLAPNPARDRTSIVFGAIPTTALQLEISDDTGRKLRSESIPAGVDRFEIYLGDLPNGVLTVQLKGENGTGSKVLLKS